VRNLAYWFVTLCAAMVLSDGALAQTYPDHAISLVVPFTPGSGPDILARGIATLLSDQWGQPIIVENKPGATGNIGARAVARAPADGYTLLLTVNGGFVMTAAVEKSLPYDPIKDFTHIAKVATGGLALVVNPEVLPVKSVDELVAAARAQPGKLNYASAGNGSQPHLAIEVLKQKFGLDMFHVPHKGQAQAVTELLAGRMHLMMLPVHTALPYVASGKLRVLAVPSKMQARFAPNLPTFAEVGLPEVLAELYYWVAAPANTPKEIISKLNQTLASLIAKPEVEESLLKQGLVTEISTEQDITRQIGQDIEWWKKFASEAKLTE